MGGGGEDTVYGEAEEWGGGGIEWGRKGGGRGYSS